MKIKYVNTDHRGLELIRPLWEGLINHQSSVSSFFSESILTNINKFEQRSRELLKKAEEGALKITFAFDEETGEYVGYCMGSITKENLGEVESLYLSDQYRGKGIGDVLITQILEWFNENKVEDIHILVIYGNERVLPFYERFGFYPRSYSLKKKN